MNEAVGIIGFGLLGSAVAERWLQAGYHVVAFDRNDERARAAETAGVRLAADGNEIWQQCSRVALVLPDSRVSREVMEQSSPRSGTIVLDMTTGDPDDMAAIALRSAARQVAYLDTTIGGSSTQVRAGEAIVMAGGEKTAFENCRDLLKPISARSFYLGASGSGARMKLALNLVLGLNRAVLAEGLAFAQACGLDGEQALEVFRSGPAYSKAMDTKGPKMLRGDFTPEARLAQHRKDVELIVRQAEVHSARIPLSRGHLELLRELEISGHGTDDNSAIIRAFRKHS